MSKATISTLNSKILFGKSGFQCAICNCSLYLGDKHIAEQAHIYGEKPTAARYDPNQNADFVNSHQNLILLCPTCHTIIDKVPTDEWTAEKLFAIKQAHEQKILVHTIQPEPRLIVKVIEKIYQALENIQVDEQSLAITTRPTQDYLRKTKNPANDMQQGFMDYLCEIYLKNTNYIDEFLANPNNSTTAQQLQTIVKKINKKLWAENNGKLTTEYFQRFCEETLKEHKELCGDNKEDTIDFILFYLYWHCDIGLKQ